MAAEFVEEIKKAEAEADAIIKESQAQAGETVKAAEAERETRLAQAVLQARRAACAAMQEKALEKKSRAIAYICENIVK